jgi:hypothetical protein
MRSIKTLGLALAMALVLVACVGATSASATTICVVGTTQTANCPAGEGAGGAVTVKSTNASFTVAGQTWSCTTSSIAGTAPATSSSTVSWPVALRYGAGTSPAGSCTSFGFVNRTITPNAACDPGGVAPITLNVSDSAGAPLTTWSIPSGCTITINIASIGCTMTISGPQTIGNGPAGAGGISWSNATPPNFSTTTLNSPTFNVVSNGIGFGCPAAGAHTGTLTGMYTVTSPNTAPGATVQP